ncbi:MAG: hypothetical protein ACI9FD_004921 [Gammaproteobacteria bacterium]|jgi:hypothetical protein
MIPKIIHQIWIGPRQPPQAMLSWRDRHPEWDYYLWTEETIDFPLQNQEQYEASPTYSGKSNVIRYELMHRYGGVYIDADTGCLNTLPDSMLIDDFFAVFEDEQALPGRVGTTYFGCIPECPVMHSMIRSISNQPTKAIASTPSWKITGPLPFTEAIENVGDGKIYPSYLFFPYHHSGNCCSDEQFEKAYAIHLWDTTFSELGGYPDFLRDYADIFLFSHPEMDSLKETKEYISFRRRIYELNDEAVVEKDIGDCFTTMVRGQRFSLSAENALILSMCKGEMSVQQITENICQIFPDQTSVIRWDVPLSIFRLVKIGVLKQLVGLKIRR